MKLSQSPFAIAITCGTVLLLIGLGLCGVGDVLDRHTARPQEFGGGTTFFGFGICLISVVVLILTCVLGLLGWITDRLASYFREPAASASVTPPTDPPEAL